MIGAHPVEISYSLEWIYSPTVVVHLVYPILLRQFIYLMIAIYF
jgi:hypothetical protein